MAGFKSLLTALLVVIVCASGSAQGVEETSAAQWDAFKAISHSNVDFANSLYQVLSRKTGNLIFSPASIQTILALTSLGARGTTAQEMIQGLHLPADQQQTKDGFRHLTNAWRTTPGVTLKVANKIFTDTRYPVTSEFNKTATEDFYSASEVVDFEKAPEAARATVNKWVKENTEGKIVDLLPPASVDTRTAVILANAVYFKGKWATMFDAAKTNTKPFHVSADVTKDIPMMHLKINGQFGYKNSEVLNAQILEIPYIGKKISLVIILPNERHGLKDVEAKLAQVRFSNISSSIRLSRPEVTLSLPKFKLEESLDMQQTLEQMGMGQMFQPNAEFTGLATGPISVSKVVHKAFVEVNEEGTEAAAATAVVGWTRSSPRMIPEVTFNANHPFIFMLASTETGGVEGYSKERNILFMGRYAQP